MPTPFRLPPSAACLSASMRDLGYSLETAIADLVDNSISASATQVDIRCEVNGTEPLLCVVDNGEGMTEDELIIAMRHGSRNPSEQRPLNDLGRFGLGLKTASFSQCRHLTVVTKKRGRTSGAEWNLTTIDELDDWILGRLGEDEISSLPNYDCLGSRGTLVIWRDLDRLFEDVEGARRSELIAEKLDAVDRHLSLVFHRFLSGEFAGSKKLRISINGHPLKPFDPFCKQNRATQHLPEETVYVSGSEVRINPFILPHHSRLSPHEYEFYRDRSDFLSNQGVYIYRNGRLMAWGDWFRLVPKGEATKLARVQIDFDNSVDEAWTIDIKKSRAWPPVPVRERVRQILTKVVDRSTRVHQQRGAKLFTEAKAPIWERIAQQKQVRYQINRAHPIFEAIASQLPDSLFSSFELLVSSMETSLPIEMIYCDYSQAPRETHQVDHADELLEIKLSELKEILSSGEQIDRDAFAEVARSTRLFDKRQDLLTKFIEREFS